MPSSTRCSAATRSSGNITSAPTRQVRSRGVQILITGAAGMIGRKLTERLANDGTLNGQPIAKLTLLDVVLPAKPAGFKGTADSVAADLAAPGAAAKAVAHRPQAIFHLAG